MSIPKSPAPAKLLIGSYMKDKGLFSGLYQRLVGLYGEPDMISAWMPFGDTDYYEEEMGSPLWRRVISFKKLIDQMDLSEIKISTNRIESDFEGNGRRKINIDPGYMLAERFVLATGKNFSHRIHVGNGIYADLTLIYRGNGFKALPWTYPDYAKENMTICLERIRAKYRLDLESLKEKEES